MKTRVIQLSALLALAASSVIQATENITTDASEVTTNNTATNEAVINTCKKPVKKTALVQTEETASQAATVTEDVAENTANPVKTVVNPAIDITIKQAAAITLTTETAPSEEKIEVAAQETAPEAVN